MSLAKEKMETWDAMQNYSTDEQVVGTWIDGKSLYQKTYAVNISADGSNGNLIATDISISFVVNGCVVLEGGTDWILINDTIKKMKSDGKIYCWTPGMGGATIKYVTIQYTKTTD